MHFDYEREAVLMALTSDLEDEIVPDILKMNPIAMITTLRNKSGLDILVRQILV